MRESQDEIELIDILNVIWRRKILIIIPTLILVIAAAVVSSILPEVWEVNAIVQPSKFLTQNGQGQFEEIVVVAPEQISGQINEATYNALIAAELNMDKNTFPRLIARQISNTSLISISIKHQVPQKAKSILFSLFSHLKGELDKKIDVEIKSIDTEISKNENQITHNELLIKDYQSEIKIKLIEKNKNMQEIEAARNKMQISETRANNIVEEMKSVKKRTDDLVVQQKNVLAEKKEENESLSLFLLLYSTEVQQNLRYYNTLDQQLSNEKIIRENLLLQTKGKTQENRQLDAEIEKLRTEISKINNKIEDIKSEITLLSEKKARIDFAQLIKEPTVSIAPVSPRKMLIVFLTGSLSLLFFTMLAFLIEYIETKTKENKPI